MNKRKLYEYTAVFQEEKSGGYSAWVPELPGCASQGETFEESFKNIKEAIALYLEDETEDITDSSHYKQQFVVPVKVAHA